MKLNEDALNAAFHAIEDLPYSTTAIEAAIEAYLAALPDKCGKCGRTAQLDGDCYGCSYDALQQQLAEAELKAYDDKIRDRVDTLWQEHEEERAIMRKAEGYVLHKSTDPCPASGGTDDAEVK